MSAVAAREGFEGRWTIDLSENRHQCEQDPSSLAGSDALFLASSC
jgi:hypothetical protein